MDLSNNGILSISVNQIAKMAWQKMIFAPMMVLWQWHFSQGHDDLANGIWSKNIVPFIKNIHFRHILDEARRTKNTQMIAKLIDLLQTTIIKRDDLGIAYSGWLDLLTELHQHEQALSILKKALTTKQFELFNFNRDSLINLKKCVEAAGQQFPYRIPAKNRELRG